MSDFETERPPEPEPLELLIAAMDTRFDQHDQALYQMARSVEESTKATRRMERVVSELAELMRGERQARLELTKRVDSLEERLRLSLANGS